MPTEDPRPGSRPPAAVTLVSAAAAARDWALGDLLRVSGLDRDGWDRWSQGRAVPSDTVQDRLETVLGTPPGLLEDLGAGRVSLAEALPLVPRLAGADPETLPVLSEAPGEQDPREERLLMLAVGAGERSPARPDSPGADDQPGPTPAPGPDQPPEPVDRPLGLDVNSFLRARWPDHAVAVLSPQAQALLLLARDLPPLQQRLLAEHLLEDRP